VFSPPPFRAFPPQVRGLCRNYESQVTELFSANIRTLLEKHASDPRGSWKAKDVAFYLVIALTLKGGTSKLGATQTNSLVDLIDFYTKHVAPELAAAASGAAPPHPVLIADAVKFVTVFRAQLPRPVYESVMPLLVALLSSPNLVVHTYAAAAIERMLTVREPAAAGAQGERRFGAPQLRPLLEPLLTNLFGILQQRGSEENAHAMRAIMRVTVVAEGDMAPYVTVCVEALKSILARVCANPSNPTFNHFLFETVASLVKHICAATPAAVNAFEQLLFPPFQTVLQMDIAEFTPYVFQV
jgi:exportin-2 (importin alpha re-exporter)